jgi:hypothetical protein
LLEPTVTKAFTELLLVPVFAALIGSRRMSDDEDIDLTIFARPSGGRQPERQLSAPALGSDNGPPLARAQRRIASEQRSLDEEVSREKERAALIRQLTLNGLEAKKQAHERACAGAQPTAPTPEQHSVTVAEAYSLAVASERRYGSAASTKEQDDVVRLWQLVYSIAEAELRVGGDPESLSRAQMTALCHQAPFYERRLQYRFAINLLERVVTLSKGRRKDAATCASLVAVFRKLASLYTSIGAVEKAQQRIVSAHSLQLQQAKREAPRKPIGEDPAGSATRLPPSGAIDAAPSISDAGGQELSAAAQSFVSSESSVVCAPPSLAPSTAGSAAIEHGRGGGSLSVPATIDAGTPVHALSAAPAPRSAADWTAAFDHPDDGSAGHAFLQAMREAMLTNSFEALLRLLNQALLGDRHAQAVLHSPMSGSQITAVMVAAGAGRPDVLRRLLAPLSPQRIAQAILHDRDFAGNNAIHHACATEQLAAVDELLRALCSVRAWGSLIPTSLPHLGLDEARLLGYVEPVQLKIRTFLRDGPGSARAAAGSGAEGSWMPEVQAGRPLPPVTAPPPPALLMMQMQAAFQAAALQQHASLPAPGPLPIGIAGPLIPRALSATGTGPVAPLEPSVQNKEGKAAVLAPTAAVASAKSGSPAAKPAAAALLSRKETPSTQQHERVLVPMLLPPADAASDVGGLEDSSTEKGSWDQFAANAALGVRFSGFQEEKYTSVLDRGSFSAQQVGICVVIDCTFRTRVCF